MSGYLNQCSPPLKKGGGERERTGGVLSLHQAAYTGEPLNANQT